MASVGWQVGAGGVPIPISSISRTTYGKKGRPKSRPALAAVFPLRDIHDHEEQSPKQKQLQRALPPLLVPKRVNASESADYVVLTSADGANFRVSRSVLAYTSPVFQRLFSSMQTQKSDAEPPVSSSSSVISDADTLPLPLPRETLADGTPVIRMQESGKTLDALLRYLYPFSPSPHEHPFTGQTYRTRIDSTKPVLLAAHKYAIRPILDEICSRLLLDLLLPPSNEEEDPFALRVYALACLVKRRNLAEAAGYAALRVGIMGVYFPELEELPAVYYFRLLDYHRRCVSTVLQFLADNETSEFKGGKESEKFGGNSYNCPKCKKASPPGESKAFWKHYRSRVADVVRESPMSQQILAPDFIIEVFSNITSCEECNRSVLRKWEVLSVALKDDIEQCIHKVKLDLNSLDSVEQSGNETKAPPTTFNVFHKFATMK